MVYELAAKLRDLRLKSKLSQKEVALQLGISPSIVSAYESEDRTPSVEVLMSLASLYQCSCDYLLGLDRTLPKKYLDVSALGEEEVCALQVIINAIKSK